MPGELVISVAPGSNGSQGLGYVAPGGSSEIQGAGLAATAQNLATFINSYSPAPTQVHTSAVDQHGPQNPPALTSQHVARAISVGLAAAPAVKSLLVAAGASAAVPAVGWIASGAAILAAGAITAVHIARARRRFNLDNSGDVLYIDQGDWSKIEDAILNGLAAFDRHTTQWVPRPDWRYNDSPSHCCSGKRVRGHWIYFYPHTIPPSGSRRRSETDTGWHTLPCFDVPRAGVLGCKPNRGYGAVVTPSPGAIVASDLVRVGAHAMLLTVYGKGQVDRALVDSFTDYIVASWRVREYASQRIGELLRASRDLPRPPGFESYAYYSAHPQGAEALRRTGWFPVWYASAAAGWSAAMQFNVFAVEDYWRNGSPINACLLQQLYFLYTWALYAGLPWDFVYKYLTGAVSELPVFALVSAPTPVRPPLPSTPTPPPPVADSVGGEVVVSETSSGSKLLGLPAWLLPVLAVGLVLLKRKR